MALPPPNSRSEFSNRIAKIEGIIDGEISRYAARPSPRIPISITLLSPYITHDEFEEIRSLYLASGWKSVEWQSSPHPNEYPYIELRN